MSEEVMTTRKTWLISRILCKNIYFNIHFNIYLSEKKHTQNMVDKLVPDTFIKNGN